MVAGASSGGAYVRNWVLLVIRPSDAARALMVLMGISLLLDGILNICVAWFCVKIVRNQRPDGIDEEYEELKDE